MLIVNGDFESKVKFLFKNLIETQFIVYVTNSTNTTIYMDS